MTELGNHGDTFEGAPPPMGFFSPSNHKGALVLFVPQAFEANKEFPFGRRDCTISAVWVIVGNGAGCEWPAAEITGVMMAGQLATRIGGKVLGRVVEQGSGAKKPFVIATPTSDDIALAMQWMAAGDNRSKVERAQRAAAEPAPVPAAAPVAGAGEVTGPLGLPTPPPVTRTDEPPF